MKIDFCWGPAEAAYRFDRLYLQLRAQAKL